MWWIILIVIIIVVGGILQGDYNSKKKNERAVSMQKKLIEIENFTVSRQVNGFGGFYIFAIDETHKKIGLVTETDRNTVDFSEIIGVEIIEDGNTISKKSTTRTIGGAIVGSVIAGGAGTIVGGLSGNSTQKNKVSSLSVKILLRSLEKPSLLIKCFDSRTMTTEHKSSLETEGKIESYIYKMGKKNADEIKDLISIIIDRSDKKSETLHEVNSNNPSNLIADELLKLNGLKEKGILTEDEFRLQKNKILNQ